jgi:hypothetical protein
MDAKILLETMRSQRKRWVPIKEGKEVQILLPTEFEVLKHFVEPGEPGKLNLKADYEEVKTFVCGWKGFTEADLLGAAVGASDALEFHADLWAAYVADNLECVRKVAKALLEGIGQRTLSREADTKN